MSRQLSRRTLLQMMGVAGAGVALAACAPATAPAPAESGGAAPTAAARKVSISRECLNGKR